MLSAIWSLEVVLRVLYLFEVYMYVQISMSDIVVCTLYAYVDGYIYKCTTKIT